MANFVQYGSDDMSMSDDDGGVSLGASSHGPSRGQAENNRVPESQPTSSLSWDVAGHQRAQQPPPPAMYTQLHSSYLQDLSISGDPEARLWRTSMMTLEGNQAPAKLLRSAKDEGGKLFHKWCSLIKKNWDCKAAKALPGVLQGPTSYSLALLLQLRMLSSFAKNDCKNVQAIIVDHWKSRMQSLQLSPDPAGRRFQSTVVLEVPGLANPQHLQQCEQHIQENVYGLTLEDVAKALQTAKRLRNGLKKAMRDDEPVEHADWSHVSEARWQQMSAQAQAREPRIIARRELKRAKKLAKLDVTSVQVQAVIEDTTRKIALEKIQVRRPTAKATWSSATPLTVDDVRTQRVAQTENAVGGAQAPFYNANADDPHRGNIQPVEDAAQPDRPFSGQDHQAYRQITSLLKSNLHLGGNVTQQNEKKRKTVQALAEAGRGTAPDLASLSSERVDFRSIGGLHTRVEEVNMAEAMDALDLAQMGQQSLPPVLEKTSYDVSKDDNTWFRR
ncbi:hypothetical protein LTR08_000546 [Meristemomyces frigidus]|nr:hypothetical protein LTR08_000546 [Meristemomyces frigidus]